MWATLATPFLGLAKFIAEETAGWVKRRQELQVATFQAKVAEIKARAEIAAYKVKADVEWDLAWAGQAERSWKDEYLLILWTVPVLPFLLSLFVPSMRPFVFDILEYVQGLNEDMIMWYMAGWSVIFSATFGLKAALGFMQPGKVAKIAEAFKDLPDDIPEAAIAATNERVKKFLDKGPGLY